MTFLKSPLKAVFLIFTLFTSTVIAKDESIVLMGDISFVPYEFVDNGQLAGMNIELLREIEKTIGRPIKIELQQWEESQQRINSGEGSGLTMLTRNEQREKLYDFSLETFSMRFSLFVPVKNANTVSIDNLAGKKIAVKRGGFPESVLEKRYTSVTPVFVENVSQGFKLMLNGQVDGVFEHEWVGYHTLQSEDITGIQALSRPLATRPAYIALRKGNPALLVEINTAIEQIKSDGRYESILNNWSGEQIILVKSGQAKTYTIILSIIVSSLLTFALIGLISRKRARTKIKILESLATTDEHTLLATRQSFDQQTQKEWRRMLREKKPLSMVLFEIDDSSSTKFNIKKIANTLSSKLFRPGDLAASYDNGIFSVLLPNTDGKGSQHVAELMRKSILDLKLTKRKGNASDYVTVNVGVSNIMPNKNTDLDKLSDSAMKALKIDKAKTKAEKIIGFGGTKNTDPHIA